MTENTNQFQEVRISERVHAERWRPRDVAPWMPARVYFRGHSYTPDEAERAALDLLKASYAARWLDEGRFDGKESDHV